MTDMTPLQLGSLEYGFHDFENDHHTAEVTIYVYFSQMTSHQYLDKPFVFGVFCFYKENNLKYSAEVSYPAALYMDYRIII